MVLPPLTFMMDPIMNMKGENIILYTTIVLKNYFEKSNQNMWHPPRTNVIIPWTKGTPYRIQSLATKLCIKPNVRDVTFQWCLIDRFDFDL